MKKHFLLLALLTSLSLSGCDAFESFINDTPTEEKDGKKDEDTKTDDEDKKEEEKEDSDDEEQEVVLESISVEGSLTKKQYYLDDEWSSDGIWIDGHYSNGDVKVLDSNDYDLGFNPYKASSLDITEVTVSVMLKHDDLPCKDKTFEVKVFNPIPKEKEIVSIEIKNDLEVKTYKENDNWDPAGLTVEATFDDTTKSNLTSDDYTLSYDPSKALKDTTSVKITALLNNSNIKDEKSFNVTVKNEYTISFDGNGATSGNMASVKTTESSYQLPSCEYQKDNYTFDKWALNSVSGTKYNPGEFITLSSNITLYAIWKYNPAPVQYTISFNGNGATSGSMSSVTITETSYLVPDCAFQKNDYSFKNWALNSKTGVSYTPGETIKNISNNLTLYAIWEKDSSGGDDAYYSECAGLSGSALQAKLLSINAPKSPSYDWSRYEDADEALDDSTSILCVYTRHNIKKNSHCGSYAWDKWNREHVWTQSAYPASDKDNHNIFACEGQINNYRGNLPYNEGGTVITVFGHTTECKMVSGTSFEPCDAAKGEIARSIMYGTVMYSYTMTKIINSIALALKWHLEHPITERDIKRNEVVYGNQGNRNPFVDHPEYACKIWGNTNSQTKSLCGLN